MVLKLTFFLALSVTAVVVVIRQIEARSIFFPMKGAPAVTGNSAAHEDVFFETADDKKLHGWFVPAASNNCMSSATFGHLARI
jgi:hypothetical protein